MGVRRPSALDAVLVGDEGLLVERQAAIELLVVEEQDPSRAFRRQFVNRLVGAKTMALSTVRGEGAAEEETPAPEPCRTCPKLYGL